MYILMQKVQRLLNFSKKWYIFLLKLALYKWTVVLNLWKILNDCAKKESIDLFVLPPKSPKYNGTVERCNDTTRNEPYSQHRDIFNVHSIRRQLEIFNNKYNIYRPHQSLGNLTPMEYFKRHYQKVRGAA